MRKGAKAPAPAPSPGAVRPFFFFSRLPPPDFFAPPTQAVASFHVVFVSTSWRFPPPSSSPSCRLRPLRFASCPSGSSLPLRPRLRLSRWCEEEGSELLTLCGGTYFCARKPDCQHLYLRYYVRTSASKSTMILLASLRLLLLLTRLAPSRSPPCSRRLLPAPPSWWPWPQPRRPARPRSSRPPLPWPN